MRELKFLSNSLNTAVEDCFEVVRVTTTCVPNRANRSVESEDDDVAEDPADDEDDEDDAPFENKEEEGVDLYTFITILMGMMTGIVVFEKNN